MAALGRRYIASLTPRRISHQFIGKVVAKPSIIAICIINQKAQFTGIVVPWLSASERWVGAGPG